MAEEWVCEECSFSSSSDPGQRCPGCGGNVVHLGDDYEENIADLDDDRYNQDDLNIKLDPEEDDEKKEEEEEDN